MSAIAGRISLGESFDNIGGSDLSDALREISFYMQEKSLVADRIATGDLSATVFLRSDTDAFGQSFQNMIDKLRQLVQTREERDRLQKSIVKLLDEVSEVAAGDLTVQAEVSPEMTGAIAKAFNSMTKELRSLIRQVKDVTFQVSGSANAINDTTEQLAAGSEAQASQISRTTAAISGMASANSGSFGKRVALGAGCGRFARQCALRLESRAGQHQRDEFDSQTGAGDSETNQKTRRTLAGNFANRQFD